MLTKGKVLLLSLIVIYALLPSCKPNADQEQKQPPVVIDTTPIGKQLAEVSRKIAQNPNDASLYNLRAQLHLKRNDIANAGMDITQTLQLDSTKAEYYLTASDVNLAGGQPGKSVVALQKAIELDPKNIKAKEKLAELYFIAMQYDKSIQELDNILRIDIHDAKAYFMKGMNFKEKGDTNRAVGSFQTAIEQRSDYYEPYVQLALIYTAQANKLAMQYYDGALRLNPKSEEALYGRGMYYQEVVNDYDKAIQDYTSITLINPKSFNAYFNLGFIHYQYLKVYGEAIKHYSKAIEYAPNWPEAYFNRGLTFETSGDIARAKVDYQKAIELRPDYEKAKIALARVGK
jgi:tetratricopeptide (TPR) repeat protein